MPDCFASKTGTGMLRVHSSDAKAKALPITVLRMIAINKADNGKSIDFFLGMHRGRIDGLTETFEHLTGKLTFTNGIFAGNQYSNEKKINRFIMSSDVSKMNSSAPR